MRTINSGMSRRLGRWMRATSALCIVLGLAACGDGQPQRTGASQAALVVAAPSVAVTGMTKVSETRVGRTEFDYVFRVTVKNNGSEARSGVIATLTGAGTGAAIIDGTVLVGDLAAGATATPQDTITIRQDRALAFDQAALKWSLTSDGNSTPEIGYRLSGSPGILAVDALKDYEKLIKTVETVDTSSGIPIVRTVLGIAVRQDATVGQVNEILEFVNGKIIASVGARQFFYIRFPDPGSIAGLQAIIASIESLPQVEFVLETLVPDTAALPNLPKIRRKFLF